MTNQATPYPLGRHEEFDERSREFNVRAIIAPGSKYRSYSWSDPLHLNQRQEPACVGFSWAEELGGRPVVVPNVDDLLGLDIYAKAHAIDGIPGDHEGTSVLAGAKIVQQMGHLDEYRWAFNTQDLFLAIGYKGPAVIGIPWMEQMFYPDAKGFVHPTGNIVGGHALSVPKVKISTVGLSMPGQPVSALLNPDLSYAGIHNHWTANWGIDGNAFISFKDLDQLLHTGGDACIPVKRR